MAVTIVASGTFDSTSSMMSYYTPGYDLFGPAPLQPPLCSESVTFQSQSNESLPHCSDYYNFALYRQHTNSQMFHDFSASAGHAFLISDSGYYVGCVSAHQYHGPGNAKLQKLDGVVTARFQKKDMKERGTCAGGSAAGTLPSGGQA
jgi:hypothetical protein